MSEKAEEANEAETLKQMRSDMKEAMRARESDRLAAIRLLISSLQMKSIDLKRELTEEEILTVLSTEAKKRREASQAYRDGGRTELADKEDSELGVIETYLPKQLTEDEVATFVDEAIAATGASSKADMGKVMGAVIPKIKGRFDGGKAKNIVMSKLS